MDQYPTRGASKGAGVTPPDRKAGADSRESTGGFCYLSATTLAATAGGESTATVEPRRAVFFRAAFCALASDFCRDAHDAPAEDTDFRFLSHVGKAHGTSGLKPKRGIGAGVIT